MKKRIDLLIVVLYFVFNLINTLFLTSTTLNQYIVSFDSSIASLVFSFIGNFAVLFLILFIGVLLIKKPKKILLFLTIVTLVLNIIIILLGYYTKSFKLAFSIHNFTIFKNPTGGFGVHVFFDWIYELFAYYRIISLLPFVILMILYSKYKNTFSEEKIHLSINKVIFTFTLIFTVQIISYNSYIISLDENWKNASDYAQYGCQYTGVYNYYFAEILLGMDSRSLIEEDIDTFKAYDMLSEYDKNQQSYINYIDGNTYSIYDDQTGILKDYNVFVIQLETSMSFYYNQSFNGIEVTPYINKLFKDSNCFYFNNVYSTVGIGTTSDAELAFFTGIIPTGDMTIAWEYANYDFDISSLGEYLDGYIKYSYNPTNEDFYYRNVLHNGLYKMDRFRGLESFLNLYPKDEYESKYLEHWISDKSILYWACENALDTLNNGKKSFSFIETISPHLPFPDMSESYDDFDNVDFGLNQLNYQLNNYLNQVRYNDKMFYDFLMDVTNPSSINYMENTVYIMYGDHSNLLSKNMYNDLYDKLLKVHL